MMAMTVIIAVVNDAHGGDNDNSDGGGSQGDHDGDGVG